MRDRTDFIDNLKMAQVHLMILKEDIKYPLGEDRQKLLDGAYLLINHLSSLEMKDDFDRALKEMTEEETQ